LVARNRYLAEDAARRWSSATSPLPAVVDVERAPRARRTVLHEPSVQLAGTAGSSTVTRRAFAEAEM